MDETMKKYECADCGIVIEVAADAGVPTCKDCEVIMEPVVADVEDIGVGGEWEDEDKEGDDDLE